MSQLPAFISVPALGFTGIVIWLSALFLWGPKRGMTLATHRPENLPTVMAKRYFSMALIMAGTLYSGNPGLIAFVFAATGMSAVHDAWIVSRLDRLFVKHVNSATLSGVIAIGALVVHLNAGAA